MHEWNLAVCKIGKRSGESNTNNNNIQSGYRNGIWHRNMYNAHNEKWKKTNNGMNRIVKRRKNQNASRKRKLLALENIANGRHHGKKIRVPQKNKKTPGNQALLQKFHHSDKHLASPPCKIFWGILKMDKGGNQTSKPKNKKDYDDARMT